MQLLYNRNAGSSGTKYVFLSVLLVSLLVMSVGCKDDDDSPGYIGPPLYVEAFVDETSSAGLDGVTATFVAWGDYDNNGLEDFVLDGRRLFQNQGGLTFTETTVAAGIDPNGGGAGAAWADINNDGYLDLFCSGYTDTTGNSLDRLYLNDGGVTGTFTDITASAGVSDLYDSKACAWGDFNGDGDIDLFVVNYEDPPGSGTGAPDRLYIKNSGTNTFTDASVASGIAATTPQIGRAVVCCDYNEDYTLDIFVANDKLCPNLLWDNDGLGNFTNVAAAAGVEGTDEGGGFFGSSTGVSWGNFDNDMDFDLLITNQKSTFPQTYEDSSHFFVNFGTGTFMDWYDISWVAADNGAVCPAWFDFNNDTQQDFYLCTETGMGSLYNGHGSGAFINLAGYANLWVSKPLGCAFAD
jgi:hypothetical protein